MHKNNSDIIPYTQNRKTTKNKKTKCKKKQRKNKKSKPNPIKLYTSHLDVDVNDDAQPNILLHFDVCVVDIVVIVFGFCVFIFCFSSFVFIHLSIAFTQLSVCINVQNDTPQRFFSLTC